MENCAAILGKFQPGAQILMGWDYFAARSARAGRGSRGPAPGFSAGGFVRGFAHVTAHHREAYFGNSHIFLQPAEVLESAQPQ